MTTASQGRTTSEKLVYAAFSRTLGVDNFSVTDGFFELGGTSLLAVRLFADLERVLGRRMPLATLLEASTVESLSAVFRSSESSQWECLTPIQTKGNRPPLFCIHAGDVHVMMYRHLAECLGDDQPVYGLEPVGLRRDRAPLETLREMATAYTADLRAQSPHGPYRLLGHCLGGAIALEVASQLEELGETVDVLAVCDGGLPVRRPLSKQLRALRHVSPAEAITHVKSLAKTRLARSSIPVSIFKKSQGELVTHSVKFASRRAFLRYTPRRCRAPITLIRSSEDVERWGHRLEQRWSLLTPAIDVRVVDVPHSQMFDQDQVERVAEIMRPLLTDS